MLRHLEIRDLLLIDRLQLDFQPGLNVLTGETGAGKSILLDALGLALGWKGRGDLVRTGAAQAEVTAVFALGPGHAARAVLDEAGLPAGEDELVLRRVAGAEGRRTAYVDDRRVSAETLRALAETLVELHGQQDDRGLLDPRGHRALLDNFGAAILGKADLLVTGLDGLRATRVALAALESIRTGATVDLRGWDADASPPSDGEAT